MKTYFDLLLAGSPLSTAEAEAALLHIGRGQATPAQMAAFLALYAARPLTVPELDGFRRAMLSLALPLDFSDFDPMDVCGTGGDGRHTFNISTTASFVVAGAGQAVAKHGNHGVSSPVGSSTVLEELGYRFTADADTLRRQLERSGICYLHAPLFHPAMQHIGPVRRELGFKTFFNLLGPLLNPARVRVQLTGVYAPEVAELFAGVLHGAGSRYTVLHTADGYDEVSLTADVHLWQPTGRQSLGPGDFLFQPTTHAALLVGKTLQDSARTLVSILDNHGTRPQTEVVLANAALALQTARPGLSLPDALAAARESLESGRARRALKRMLE